ncbi:S1/P1 nuclease [Ceratobasidium sp. AG-Ba]|nr:S1/P1 nuclease [Ceratobasidium sp. AG-Ba]
MRFSTAALSSALLAAPAWAWGDNGHKITATIAQIHLLPSAHNAICGILPQNYSCSLAAIASWPDEVKKLPQWKHTGQRHFVNAINDHPPQKCVFGEEGWKAPSENILQAIVDTTRELNSTTGEKQDIALRFLTHYLGDVHQPMHLTGRDVGGNIIPVKYQNENKSLHWVWDDSLIDYRIRSMTNYTTPLPTTAAPSIPASSLILNQRIESVLNGSVYDPLVRWIVVEGVHQWWANDQEIWTRCPQLGLQRTQAQRIMQKLPFEDPIDLPVCPYHWSVPSHQLACDFIWREDFKPAKNMSQAVYEIELETPEYGGRVREQKMIEKQLALGGMRLAAVLNAVLGSQEEKRKFGVIPRLL